MRQHFQGLAPKHNGWYPTRPCEDIWLDLSQPQLGGLKIERGKRLNEVELENGPLCRFHSWFRN